MGTPRRYPSAMIARAAIIPLVWLMSISRLGVVIQIHGQIDVAHGLAEADLAKELESPPVFFVGIDEHDAGVALDEEFSDATDQAFGHAATLVSRFHAQPFQPGIFPGAPGFIHDAAEGKTNNSLVIDGHQTGFLEGIKEPNDFILVPAPIQGGELFRCVQLCTQFVNPCQIRQFHLSNFDRLLRFHL